MIQRIINFLEYPLNIICLVLYTGGILPVLLSGGVSEGDLKYGDATADTDSFLIIKLIYPITYVIALLFLSKAIGKTGNLGQIFFRSPLVLIPVGIALLSTLWSEIPEMTISRAIALFGTTLYGIYLANRYTLKEQIVLLSNTFLVIAFLSLVFAVALPQYGVMGAIHAGALRGIYSHKNHLGQMMVMSIVLLLLRPQLSTRSQVSDVDSIFAFLSRKSLKGDWTKPPIERTKSNFIGKYFQTGLLYVGLLLSMLLIALCKSSGAVVNLVIILSFLAIFKVTQLPHHPKFFAVLGLIILFSIFGVVFLPDPESLFAIMGKSSDLTGRSDLWDLLLDTLFNNNPLLGFGYGAFWEKYKTVLAAYNHGWAAPDAHNGFLDLTLSVGLLGLVFFAMSYLHAFFKGLNNFRTFKNNEQLFPLIVLGYLVMTNMNETGLFAYNNIAWLLYVMVCYSVIPLQAKAIAFLPESRTKKPILALPPGKDGTPKYLPPSRQKKPPLALPQARSSDRRF
jgi:exopolysaccharide production protein ExoQ